MIAERLRKAVLQAAIQGKLTEQLREDGDVRELLAGIEAEKKRLIQEGKIKRQKPLPEILVDEIPFEIPENWCWVRLGEIVSFSIGKTPSRGNAAYWGSGSPWVAISDMLEGKIIKETKETVTAEAISSVFRGQATPAGTLLMSFKLTIGRVSILGMDAVHNEAIISIFPFFGGSVSRDYLRSILPYVSNWGDSKDAIKGKTLNSTSINALVLPLPPLLEQQRIVAKLEEVLPQIDKLQEEEEALAKLQGEFPQKLKNSLLQAAIQSKLTEQFPEDGDARELLAEVEAEKKLLIKEGKTKRQKSLPPSTEDEIPFEIPENWSWVRLGDILKVSSGRGLVMKNMKEKGSFLVYGGNGVNGRYDDWFVEKGTLVIGRVGFYCGSIHRADDRCWVTDNALIVDVREGIFDISFLEMLLIAIDLRKTSVSTAQPVISGKRIYPLIIPLPPLAEQQRIVARLEELLPLCDALEIG